MPTTLRIEFAKANTKVTKPAALKPLTVGKPIGHGIPSPTIQYREPCKLEVEGLMPHLSILRMKEA